MSRGSNRKRVTDHPLFADLDAAEAKALRKAAKPMTFPPGATIQRLGVVDRRCFVVLDGIVELSDGTTTIECGPGGVFGDAGSYGRKLPATALARTQVRTFVIPSLVMASLTNANARLATRLSEQAHQHVALAS